MWKQSYMFILGQKNILRTACWVDLYFFLPHFPLFSLFRYFIFLSLTQVQLVVGRALPQRRAANTMSCVYGSRGIWWQFFFSIGVARNLSCTPEARCQNSKPTPKAKNGEGFWREDSASTHWDWASCVSSLAGFGGVLTANALWTH